tara:strand:+ start:9611 stop:10333 length:723 start_codon:yes stop_codon:yes gene_type:complete
MATPRTELTLSGAAGGAATGASIGALAGGPVGALVGGAVGGIAGGMGGYAHGGYGNVAPVTSQTQQQRALAEMSGALDLSRASVLGGYDDAIRARQSANAEAIRQMRMGIAAPAAGTLVGSGAAGLLGSGAAQAGGRQAALTAGLERDRMLQAGAEQEARILQEKAGRQLGFAEQDLQALQARLSGIDTAIDNAKIARPARSDFLMWAEAQRNSYPPGSPEWEKFNNAMVLTEPNLLFSS